MTTTHKHLLGLIFGTVLVLSFLAGCGGGGGGSHRTTPVTLASIEVTPTNPSIAIGTSQQFKATGIYSDKTKKDLTSSVTWSSLDTAKATVSDTTGLKGLATAVTEGTTTIKATSGTVSGSTTLTVKAATVILDSIEVTPVNPSIALGTTQQFTATGIFSDDSKQDLTAQVTWSSLNTGFATISSTGLATPVSAGSTTIAATSTPTLGSVSGNTTLTVKADTVTLVSIEVNPTDPDIALGTTQQFTATGIFSDSTKQDLTTQATWSSSNTGFATIDNTGLATSIAAGSTSITATFGGKSGNTNLTVKAATVTLDSIEVAPTNPSIALGTRQQFTATGIFSDGSKQDITAQVTWDAGTFGFATISNAPGSEGLATSIAAGLTTITATFGGKSGSTTLTVQGATVILDSIEVSPTNPSIAIGTTQQFTATGIFSDGTNITTQDLTDLVTWDSETPGFATISNAPGSEGLATSIAAGSTAISATFGGKSGSTTLTVQGATVILDSIEVSPTNPSIALGTTQQFTATGIFSDGTNITTQDLTDLVTWDSETSGVATISNAPGSYGLATSIAAGSTAISATFGGKTGSTTLTVTAVTLISIEVTPPNPTVPLGVSQQFTATGVFSDGTNITTQDLTDIVTWDSDTPAVATISNVPGSEGLATTVAKGSTVITAIFGGKSGSTLFTVADAVLQSISITPANQTMALGTKLQYTATGNFTGNIQQDLTKQVTWSSTDTGVAVISNGAQTKGLATAIAVGPTFIRATYGGKTGETKLTVTTIGFSSIEITPASPTISVGDKLQFRAIGHFSGGGGTQDLTLSVTWSSTVKTVATVSNARKTRGMATGVSAGSTTIRATEGGVVGTTTLTVSP